MKKITKLFTPKKISSLNESERTAQFIISTDQVDRSGEIVEQSWDLEHYKLNPIVLFGHDSNSAESVVGKCEDLQIEKSDNGVSVTKALVRFAEEGTSKTADTVWKLVKQDILRTVSVGFIPHGVKNEDNINEPTVLTNNELLEFSIVPIPANPNAIALALDEGILNPSDAKWVRKCYEKQLDLITDQPGDNIEEKETQAEQGRKKSMTDEDIAKIAEAVGKAVADTIVPKLDEIASKLDEGNNEEQGDDNADDNASDTDETTLSAKSEQTDEDGAPEKFDENEQLDEEQEKAFRAELEKDYNEIINH